MKDLNDLKKFTRTTKKDFCRCLYEIENKLPRTKFCFSPCPDQIRILSERKKETIGGYHDKDKDVNI